MNKVIKEMQELIKRNVRGCLPMIESAFMENNCLCGNCVDCKALMLASGDIAENLYNAGYRKQSDTVREFVCAIQAISLTVSPDQYTPIAYLHSEIKKLAKEYGVEVE